jgi:hypothetical protein
MKREEFRKSKSRERFDLSLQTPKRGSPMPAARGRSSAIVEVDSEGDHNRSYCQRDTRSSQLRTGPGKPNDRQSGV